MPRKKQKVSNSSTAIQAGRDVTLIKTGLSYNEARDIALHVFKSNFYKLAEVAAKMAEARAEEITDEFLAKLQKEYPAGLEKSHDPDFQYALFTVQKEYARNGDKDLGDLLVDLLVDRSKQRQRDIMQIVLNESLNTAPKLTESHLAALALIFLFKYSVDLSIGNHEQFGNYLDRFAAPFVSKSIKKAASYQHLEFCGCVSSAPFSQNLESIIGNTYHRLFLKGFHVRDLSMKHLSEGLDQKFFIPCLNDSSKLQVSVLNNNLLEDLFETEAITTSDRQKLRGLFNFGKMNDAEIKEKCIEIRPYMSKLFEIWNESGMRYLRLTSVGIAIGHANIKRFAGEFENLSIWIN